MKCTDCKYCIESDYGYSNWTVEGTSADCLLRLNPAMPVDRAWGLEPELAYAEKCGGFAVGEPVQVDCDMENGDLENYSDDVEIKKLLKAFEG